MLVEQVVEIFGLNNKNKLNGDVEGIIYSYLELLDLLRIKCVKNLDSESKNILKDKFKLAKCYDICNRLRCLIKNIIFNPKQHENNKYILEYEKEELIILLNNTNNINDVEKKINNLVKDFLDIRKSSLSNKCFSQLITEMELGKSLIDLIPYCNLDIRDIYTSWESRYNVIKVH